MIPRAAAVLAFAAFLAPRAPAVAQQAAPAERTISAGDRDRALSSIAAAIRTTYVLTEKRAQIAGRLELRARDERRYDVTDPTVLAERVTADLLAASGDAHLYLSYDPVQYAAVRRADSAAPERPGQDLDAYRRRRARRANHGLAEMRVLPGNLRYLRIAAFEWIPDETGAVYDGAMRFLKDGDAAIIDLRGNGGGWHGAVQYLVSHFLPPDRLELTFREGSGTASQVRTIGHLPAGRLKDKPLYVLIDGGSASAAEAFAYDVAQFGLGTLVGATTAGAANDNRLVPIAPGFMLSVTYARPVHAVSGSNWEGIGVEPEVRTPSERALVVAESLALARLAEDPDAAPEDVAEHRWAQVGVASRLEPVTIEPARLRALAGTYGAVEVAFRDGALWLSRPGRPVRRLSPLTGDGLFAVAGTDVLRVRFTPGALELRLIDEPVPAVFGRN